MEIWYIFEILSGVGSIFHLMALSWDRLCAIVWPLKHRSYTKTKYLVIIVVVWSAATLVSGLSVTGNRNSPQAYNMTVICLCFFLPLVLIFVAQGITLVTIKRNIAKFHHNSSLKRDVRATKTILIMIGLFLIAWLPFFSLGLVRFIQDDHSELPANAIFAVKLLQYSNSLFNPILYGKKFPEFRIAYIMILCSAKNDSESTRYAISSSVNTKKFRTSSSTLSTSFPTTQRSHRLLHVLIKKREEQANVQQKDEEFTLMVSGL
ncbi:histamine H2 receptor-like [Stylophora pistillata]|uniref:histamine H2 receptor-like n=1 Tax=Stylophora pistillata TaxID=50429 RepID=UPI000C0475DF|nr:histamine H2 receptor-like [Stylophora pistillata]